MESDANDIELEWLNAQSELSNRAVARVLGVHYEVVRRARLTGMLSDALKGNIRNHIDEHGGDERSEEDDQTRPGSEEQHGEDNGGDGDEQASVEGHGSKERRRGSRRRRGGRRATSAEGRADDDEPANDVSSDDEEAEDEERESALRLMYEIVGCRDTRKLASITARIRQKHGENGGSLSAESESCHTIPTKTTLDEQKSHALSLLSETPVVRELPLGAAVSATRAVLNDEVSLLDPPLLLHGDAVLLMLTRAQTRYVDKGAREVALAPSGRRYACGLRGEDLRDGVTMEDRMRCYAHDDHRDRPRFIGTRFSDVIPEKAYPDEDFFFGSAGWTDRNGEWKPGRAEIIARWRHLEGLCDDWGAQRPRTRWQYALAAEKAELELTLLSHDYAMTFDREILGDARWPTSTRLGHQTQSRLLLLAGHRGTIGRLGTLRLLSALALWLPRLPLSLLGRLARTRRVRERIVPTLYGPVSEQGWLTRVLSWLLYRRHSELDGSVCGKRVWKATSHPISPDYVTPHPVSGYVPSEAFRRRFRHHEFEPGWATSRPEAAPPGRLARALGGLAAGIRRLTGRRSNVH